MKRFLAVFAIMAMVVSMFSGVAFAAPADYKIDLDSKAIYYGTGGSSFKHLAGRILDDDSGGIIKDDFTLEVDGVTGSSIDVENGRFDELIPTSSSNYGIGNYTLRLPANTPSYNGATVDFRIVNEIELETPAKLEFDYPVSGQQIIQGVFVNGDFNDGPYDLVLSYQDSKTNHVGEAVYLDEDSFGFLVDGADFNETGDIGIYVVTDTNDYVLAVEGEVTSDTMELSASPTTLYRGLGTVDQEVTFKFDLDKDYLDSPTNTAIDTSYYELILTVEDKDEATIASKDITSIFDDQEAVVNFQDPVLDVDSWDRGRYNVIVELKELTPSFVVEKAEIEFKVENPREFTLVNWDEDKELSVGDNNFVMDTDIRVMYHDGTSASAISVLNTTSPEHYMKVVYEGAGIKSKTFTYDPNEILSETGAAAGDKNRVLTLTVSPTKTGVVAFDIYVYDEDKKEVASYKEELDVTGWNVSVSPLEVMVDTENDFIVEITNEDGEPVNNAIVEIEEAGNVAETVNGTTTNINNGIYLFEDLKLKTVTKYDVVAYSYDGTRTKEVTLANEIEVVGEEVLLVDTDTPVMVNGLEEDIYVSVLDEEGDVVYPFFEVIQYDADGDEVSSDDNITGTLSTGSRKDLDNDGVKEAIKIEEIKPDADVTEIIVRAYADDEKKEMGQVAIEVLEPVLEFEGSTVITENFETELEFTVVDPRDDGVIEEAIELKYSTTYYKYDRIENLRADRDDVWTATVLVQEVEWDDAEEDEEKVEVVIEMDGMKVGAIEVKKATLTSDPEKVIIGSASNLVVTYLDGDGNPIEDRKVMLDGEEIAETDEEGKVVYATSTVSSVAIKFEAETDAKDTVSGDDIYTELSVKSTADIEGPVATVEVDGDTAIITIEDNVRVQKVMINGESVDMFFAMPTVTVMKNLNPGVNTFDIQAVDINNNYSQTTLEVEPYQEAEVSFTVGESTEYGTPVMMEATTMVPVRFAEQLGATLAWDAPTATVTYTAGDVVIKLTQDSTTAVVNGENVELRVAPFMNDQYRLMVPIRMISEELGYTVIYTSSADPIVIK